MPAPWPESVIPLPEATRHHLVTVLRLGQGAEVSYTDGRGTVGQGSLGKDGLERGQEEPSRRPDALVTVAVVPPNRGERARFAVEKLAELGVDRLIWLQTVRGEGRPPPPAKATAWAVAALEQSQGAFLMDVSGPMQPGALDVPLFAAVPGGGSLPVLTTDATLAVGPEGGWSGDELPASSIAVGLGQRTLRTETAAIVFATLALERAGRLGPGR